MVKTRTFDDLMDLRAVLEAQRSDISEDPSYLMGSLELVKNGIIRMNQISERQRDVREAAAITRRGSCGKDTTEKCAFDERSTIIASSRVYSPESMLVPVCSER